MQNKHWELFEKLDFDNFLDDMGQNDNVQKVLIGTLESVSKELSIEAIEAVKAASAYQQGSIDKEELVTHQIKMWNLIKGRDCHFKDEFVCKIRLVICVLCTEDAYSTPYEILDIFMDFYDKAGFKSENICESIEKVYGSYLKLGSPPVAHQPSRFIGHNDEEN